MAPSLKPLSDQVIVLTGALGAVGLCIAQLAAHSGARLVLVSRPGERLNNMMASVQPGSGHVIHVGGHVSSREELAAAADAAVQRFGRINTWINNAEMSIYGRLDEVSEADSRRLFDINFWGVVNGSLAALPHLISTAGSLINVGSEVACATPMQGMYVSSKEAVRAFTNALRLEVQGSDRASVSITLIEPAAALGDRAGDPSLVAQAILLAAETGGAEQVAIALAEVPVVKLHPPWAGDPPLPFDAGPVSIPAVL